ncbi:D-alanyl-D-alanine carboxypeptidase/D-alanyl-D-alanine-endopeptidase (penicillin-binding protein 4) [Streptomyces sp. 3211.6]|uniref:D-alanyl-D-alanine carboxypeptidase/D-alanyl-D-alanine endopeptidase n=1 Tax=Streptomyces TaxID=1883 RepID=UPI000CC60B50|nr:MULTISPECIES: D-alanyl-D-alanine carboxypeptidase/D-alanyl-D-alanine-endopeptidase [Streptomyces]RKT08461.1 D-alanyl-D-alanine carboxypeptidase/D-alanyl-D-alanine-endopeptidase (penicillin-binding protein 4) [Streptomyces sp. 3211.6]RPF29860.1 D-alanyl-D-alanine carboxypeptidase/D-alanyl-D-alanine-endopeptidase (penicillin-binding protein 4) [Streptomyces sp. Ag109_G2-6]
MGHPVRCAVLRRRVGAGCAALLLAVFGAGASARAAPGPPPSPSSSGPGDAGRLPPQIREIMGKPEYRHAQWGLLQTGPEGGPVVRGMFPEQFFIPGSTAKLFSVSGTWRTLGTDHRFVTPVYAVGQRSGGTLTGDLDLVAQGDLTLGGRTRPDGTVAYTDLDHTYANDFPGATLTPENPLAGIDELARQVRRSGITRVDGEVVVDSRLFAADPVLDPTPTPLIVNDNLVDLLTTPGDRPGADARLDWRPKVAPYEVTSAVKTVAAGKPTAVTVTADATGTRIRLSGTIAAGSAPLLRTSPVTDPAAFGRTALIEALGRAGVEVSAAATGANPAGRLPRDYEGDPRVAAYTSPPYEQYARLILKVSHNLGANLGICLMAVTAGSAQCADGFPVLAAFLGRAGVDRGQVELMDGRGGNPADRATPRALVQMLAYWQRGPDARRFREALPILGVDGLLAANCRSCPARGKVFAKTGAAVGGDALGNGLAVGAITIAGYLDRGGGRFEPFYAGVNGASTPNTDPAGILSIGNDVALVAAALQETPEGP